MSYQHARDSFDENCQLIGVNLSGQVNDPIAWNLNNGLTSLATAIEQDLAQIQHTLNQILLALQR